MIPQLMIGGVAIEGHEINVSGILDMPKTDLSGQGSATDKGDQGVKPKRITVMLLIPFANADWLSRIVTLAEQLDSDGQAVPHVIVDQLCKALNIRQVTFSGQVNMNESDSIRAWDVSFQLSEHKSPAEVAESRSPSRGDAAHGASFTELAAMVDGVVK